MNFGMGVGIAYFPNFGVLCFGWSLGLLVPYSLYQAKGQFWGFLPYVWALRSLEGERVSCNFLCVIQFLLWCSSFLRQVCLYSQGWLQTPPASASWVPPCLALITPLCVCLHACAPVCGYIHPRL